MPLSIKYHTQIKKNLINTVAFKNSAMHWNPLCDTNKIEILTRDFKIPWSIQMQDFFVILDTYCIIKKIHFF